MPVRILKKHDISLPVFDHRHRAEKDCKERVLLFLLSATSLSAGTVPIRFYFYLAFIWHSVAGEFLVFKVYKCER